MNNFKKIYYGMILLVLGGAATGYAETAVQLTPIVQFPDDRLIFEPMRPVADPLQEFLDYVDGLMYRDEVIKQIRIDLNEDGVDELFYSTSSEMLHAGGRAWTAYISTPNGYGAKTKGDLSGFGFESWSIGLYRLANGRLAIQHATRGGNFFALYINEGNQFRELKLNGPLNIRIADIKEEVYKLEEIMSPAQLAQLPDRTHDFFSKKRTGGDKYDKNIRYVYDRETKEFLGLFEPMKEQLIPIEVIDEPVRALIKERVKKASIRPPVYMGSDEDMAVLKQIQDWYQQWKKDHPVSFQTTQEDAEIAKQEIIKKIEAGVYKPLPGMPLDGVIP